MHTLRATSNISWLKQTQRNIFLMNCTAKKDDKCHIEVNLCVFARVGCFIPGQMKNRLTLIEYPDCFS